MEFIIGKEIITETPTIDVDNKLGTGGHIFELRVADNATPENVSKPVRKVVVVADQEAPTAILKVDKVVPQGRPFKLDGTDSIDAGGGKVVKYMWTYVGRENT